MSDGKSAERYIVIIDDDQDINLLMERYLAALKYDSKAVQKGIDGLKLIRSDPGKVGLVLLDLAMPQMDGFEVCRSIRKDPATKDIPIVAFTAKASAEARKEILEAGANEVVTKPFRHEDLAAALKKHFREKSDPETKQK